MLLYETHCVTSVRAFLFTQYEHYVFRMNESMFVDELLNFLNKTMYSNHNIHISF